MNNHRKQIVGVYLGVIAVKFTYQDFGGGCGYIKDGRYKAERFNPSSTLVSFSIGI